MMIDQTQLISSAFPLVGGGAIGFGIGYVIKKIMKLAFIGLGLVMLVLGFLEYKHWISVNWTVTANQSSAILTHLANKIATVTQHMNHEIPIGMGLLGFAPEFFLDSIRAKPEMKFLHLFKSSSTSAGFAKIQGYEDIKDIVRRVLESDENYNLLFVGTPASSKTLFLQGILEIRKDGVYFDGSNTTNRILDVLEEGRPNIICIDELDKMPRTFQNQLLNFMECGRIKVDQQRKQYDFQIKGAKVFATCNEINRISKPLQSRFRKLFLPKYTEEQFLGVSEKVLPKLSSSLARYIGTNVWKNGGDIRDVISIGKLVRKSDGHEQIELIMETMSKYGMEE